MKAIQQLRRFLCKFLCVEPAPQPDKSAWDEEPSWVDRPLARVEEEVEKRAARCRQARRDAIRSDPALEGEHEWARFRPAGTFGLALSGGGMRSATISLGVVQGLATRRRLLDFDYCSTVSGGGYCGSFVGALFMPDYARGHVPETKQRDGRREDMPAEKASFALKALRHDPRETESMFPIARAEGKYDNREVLNPVWWLREHSRYLAPNGMTDYFVALATIVRNWLSMLYVLVLPIALLAFMAIALTWYVWETKAVVELPLWMKQYTFPVIAECEAKACKAGLAPIPLSLFFLVALGPVLFCVLALCISFWLTIYMSWDDGPIGRRRLKSLWSSPSVLVLLFAGMAGAIMLAALATYWLGFGIAPTLAIEWAMLVPAHSPYAFSFAVFFALWLAALVPWTLAHGLCYATWRQGRSSDAFTADVRRRITRWTTNSMRILVLTLVVACLDSLARWLYQDFTLSRPSVAWGAIAPVGAFLISRIPQGGTLGNTKIKRFTERYFGVAMMGASILCYGALVLIVHVGMQYLLFEGQPWGGAEGPEHPVQSLIKALEAPGGDWISRLAALCRSALYILGVGALDPEIMRRMWLTPLVLALLFALAGVSSTFINMGSLHGFYASRLTRAYLGAANVERLRSWADPRAFTRIIDTDPGDQIAIGSYQRTFAEGMNYAPIHLVNVTLNETRSDDRSQILERDRKGVPLVFGPEGMFVNAGKLLSDRTYFGWEKLKNVEVLSVGQLCAISGAAVSTGMGWKTTLGSSLAMTFANVRLGYWWNPNGLLTRGRNAAPDHGLWEAINVFETYTYLWREMTARYRRTTRRVNLSDGGHFENTGVYELLRRRVETILVCDNGTDPLYRFSDLEQLMRKARLDLGVEVTVPDQARTRQILAKAGISATAAEVFLNCGDEDWRQLAAMRKCDAGSTVPVGRGFCLMLEAQGLYGEHSGRAKGGAYHAVIVWMKPRLFEGLGHDVSGYATGHRDFPHEPMGEQFFDEEQWESYRKLGETMMSRLMDADCAGPDLLRRLDARRGKLSPP